LFISYGRLSWLPISFLLHVKYTLSYHIVSYHQIMPQSSNLKPGPCCRLAQHCDINSCAIGTGRWYKD